MANGAMVMDTLRRVASEAGVTVITTLHHVDYARRYADRVLGFRQGVLVFDDAARRARRRRARPDLRRPRRGARAGPEGAFLAPALAAT